METKSRAAELIDCLPAIGHRTTGKVPGRPCPTLARESPSEDVLDAELHRPAAQARCDESEVGQRRIRDGVAQPRPVENVERFEPDVEALRSHDGKRLPE